MPVSVFTAVLILLFVVQDAFAASGASAACVNYGHVEQFRLSEGERQSAERAALEGDASRAFAVANYYGFYRPKCSSADGENSLYWMQIAAENGHPQGMQLLGVALYGKGGRENCARAAFWEQQAIRFTQDGRVRQNAKDTLTNIRNSAACR